MSTELSLILLLEKRWLLTTTFKLPRLSLLLSLNKVCTGECHLKINIIIILQLLLFAYP